MTHPEIARDLFLQGYNCSQAVFCAFCDVTGMDMETALKLSSSFGGGLGRLREVCGAMSGAAMVVGMLYGNHEPDDDKKKAHYTRIQNMAGRFREQNGSYLCRELLAGIENDSLPTPSKRTEAYYRERPCVRFVEIAAAIVDEEIAAELNH